MITDILVAGIPMLILAADDDDQINGLLMQESRKTDRSKTKHSKWARKEYFAIFGEKGRTIAQAVKAETGAREEQVNSVMALFLPTFVDVIEEENPPDEEVLADIFHEEAEEIRSDNLLAAESQF
jgi:hypothetical protein